MLYVLYLWCNVVSWVHSDVHRSLFVITYVDVKQTFLLFIYSQLSISWSCGDFFWHVQITWSANLFALWVIWTCKKVSDAKLWLEKAIKMYFWFIKTLRVSQNSRYPSSRYRESTVHVTEYGGFAPLAQCCNSLLYFQTWYFFYENRNWCNDLK